MDNLTILKDLLRFESYPSEGVNELAEYIIKEYLEAEQLVYRKILSCDRVNLLVAVNGNFSSDFSNGLVFSGHLDTVKGYIPVVEQNGKLYGRGSVDMKFFIATVLSLIPYFKKLPYPVLFSFTSDEETSFLGIASVLDFCKKNNIKPKYCIVGEPTSFNLALNNNGGIVFNTVFHGKAGHSSVPQLGSNAIETAVFFMNLLKKNPVVNNNANNSITYNIAKIEAGIADNIIPDCCSLTYSFRFSNPVEEEIIKKVLFKIEKSVCEESKFPVNTVTTLYIKSFANINSSFSKRIVSILPELEIKSFSGATEAGYWHGYGVDSIIFGIDDKMYAHAENEHVSISSLKKYTNMIQKICDNL